MTDDVTLERADRIAMVNRSLASMSLSTNVTRA